MKVASTSPTSSALAAATMEEFYSLDIIDVSDRLKAMRRQEETTYFCIDYLKETKSPKMIDELCRTKMLAWCLQGANFGIRRDTVVISMSYLDRFLSSGTPRAMNTIKNRKEYKLASMTTLYMAIKLFEPFELQAADLAMLSKNSFAAIDFFQMEFDILSALDWHVHGPTVLSFIEHFFAVIPKTSTCNDTAWRLLLHKSKQYTELTLGDYYFVTQKPSNVAVAIISNSLRYISPNIINAADRLSFFSQIAAASKIDFNSQEISLSRKRLASIQNGFSVAESKHPFVIPCKVDKESTRASSSNLGHSSPVCVFSRLCH